MPLMLHAGSQIVTRDELAALRVPAPLGPRHKTRPFIDDVEVITDQLSSIGATLKNEAYGVLYDAETNDPRRYFGVLEIALPQVLDSGDYALQIGLRGSYDQSMTRGLAVGSRVFVCDNLAFSSEVTMKTKQTTYVDKRIGSMFIDAVQQIPKFAEHQDQQFDRYRNTTITRQEGDAMLIEMVRRNVLAPTQLKRAIEQWDSPDHPEHEEQGLSVWRLHNAVTEALKPPKTIMALDANRLQYTWNRTTKMTDFLNETYQLPMAA